MRLIPVLGGLAALAFASAASAAPVSVSFSPAFQSAMEDDIGVREGDYLSSRVVNAVNAALARRGVSAAEGSIQVDIVNADPNRPTLQQLSDTPGLDYMRSFSIGGAELHATVRGVNGQAVEVTHRRYDHTIDEFNGLPATTWYAAQRAIRQFAEKVADAYVAQSR